MCVYTHTQIEFAAPNRLNLDFSKVSLLLKFAQITIELTFGVATR